MADASGRRTTGGLKMFRALKHRGYRWFWFSGMGMTAAQGIQQLAIAWLVLDLTGSIGQLGLVIFMQGVPMALVSFYGGVLADRYDRRRLLMGAQFLTMINLLVLAALTWTGLVQMWQVYIFSAGLGVMIAVTMPARTALIRSLIADDNDMVNAVALNAVQQHSSRILWPSLAGVLIAVSGIGATLALSALCSFGGILCLMAIRGLRSNVAASAGGTSSFRQMLDGFAYVRSQPAVYTIMVLSLCCGLFGLAYMNLAPAFAREELGMGSSGAGLFIMSMGIGAIVGSAIMLLFPSIDGHRLFIILSAFFGLNILLQAVNPWTPAAFVIMAAFGLSNSGLVVAGQTFLQVTVPQQYLGRVIGLWSLAGGLGFITALPIGMLGDAVGLRWALGGAGVLLMFTAVWFGMLMPARSLKPREVPSVPS